MVGASGTWKWSGLGCYRPGWFQVWVAALLGFCSAIAGPAPITIAPAVVAVRSASAQQFTVAVGATSGPVVWSVNGVVGGNPALGTVTSNGLFTASVSNPGVPLMVTASITNPIASSSATVGWQNPLPALVSLMPATVNIGNFTVIINGSGFVPGAQVTLNGVAIPATTLSSSQISFQATLTNAQSANIVVINPAPGSSASHPLTLKVVPPIAVQVSPVAFSVRLGGSQALTSTVANALDSSVVWSVNGTVGGGPDVGWISTNGVYSAPATQIPTNSVVVTATSTVNPAVSASAVVTFLNPVPVIQSMSPGILPLGSQAISVTGIGFVPGSQVVCDGTPLPTTFVSPTSLTAGLSILANPAGALGFQVLNPAPGPTNSALWVQPIAVASPKVSYLAAARFLEQAAWGPDAATIAHVQAIGFSAWLDEQMACPISWNAPSSDTSNNLNPQQSDFIYHALTGPDQLRQRVAFALSQVFVVSALKTGQPRQIVPYQNLLLNDALGNYVDLFRDVTLSPTMGVYLDMVNNDAANPVTGTAANENYAREMLQLFSIGTLLLNPDGTPQLDSNGQSIPTYDQPTIVALSRALTGWTFPGPTILLGHNPENYTGPMQAVDANHDSGAKTILFSQVLPAGQGAAADLEAVVQAVANHPNVAPFISLRLIQHLVESNPSPDYLARISQVFTQTGGNLGQVVRAILLDPEARQADDPTVTPNPNSGHLREPLLYTINLLRAFYGQVSIPHNVIALGQVMGQQLFYSPTVFNYYSPLYQTSGGLPGPEFQLVNSATSLIRANSVYELITKQLNGAVSFDLTPLTSLASSPSDLVDAVDHALLYGRLPIEMKGLILNALRATTDPVLRARTAIYLVATSAIYQIQH